MGKKKAEKNSRATVLLVPEFHGADVGRAIVLAERLQSLATEAERTARELSEEMAKAEFSLSARAE